jgi:hypothetical protein
MVLLQAGDKLDVLVDGRSFQQQWDMGRLLLMVIACRALEAHGDV